MTERVRIGGLQVATELRDFVEQEAIPGTGIDPAEFWAGVEAVVTELAPRNRELLATRDELQGKLDAWHAEHPGTDYDREAYKAFLVEIGYLLPPAADFRIGTQNVDAEVAATAGPQLVVPVMNARFAINAANARWGSLYDALYGTDAIPETDGAEQAPGGKPGYNKVRGDKVIAFARGLLDQAAPLVTGSHAGTTRYAVDGRALAVTLADGTVTTLALEDLGDGFAAFAGARSGLIGDEDLDETASVLEPGTVAALLVYENAWAAGFVAAARAVGGEVVSSGRIAAADLMDALDELDTDA